MEVKRIHHVAYRCKDAKETVDFYQRVLNMDFTVAFAEDKVVLEDVQREEERFAAEENRAKRVGLDLDASAGLFRHMVNQRIREESVPA